MTYRAQLTPKAAGETRQYSVDFAADLASGETISTAVTTASVYSGTDASPSSLISGSASISGSQVTQKLTAGTNGVIYSVTFTITTSGGQTLTKVGYLAVVPGVV